MTSPSDLQQRIAALFVDPALPPGHPASLDAHLGLPTSSPEPAAMATQVPAPPKPRGRARRKVWELEAKFHCPLIGTCVHLADLARLAKRYGFTSDPRDDYGLHVEAVGRAGSRNDFSDALQRHLDQRYAAALDRYAAARTDAETLALWQADRALGKVAGAFWAVMSHKDADADTRQQVFRDLHMLSHQVGAGQAADVRRLHEAENLVAALRAQLVDDRRRAQDAEAVLRSQVQHLTARNVALHADSARATELQRRIEQFESGQAITTLAQQLMQSRDAHDRQAQRLARAEQEVHAAAGLRTERDALRAERDDLLRRLATLEAVIDATTLAESAADAIGDAAGSRTDCEDCPGDPAACSKAPGARPERCVLCVGGRTTLLPQYRSLAERLGFRLIHHDGGQEETLARLPEMIHAADAVLCPTDCVSHSAYYRLKRQCKRDGKPCMLFKGASVTGFAMALTRLAADGEVVRTPAKTPA